MPVPFSLTLVTAAKCGVGLWTVGIGAGGEGQLSRKPQGSGLGEQHPGRMFWVAPRAEDGSGLGQMGKDWAEQADL